MASLRAAVIWRRELRREVLSARDLYAEDQKDILVELSLPKLTAPTDGPVPVVRTALKAWISVPAY